jgi:hypothetical protein
MQKSRGRFLSYLSVFAALSWAVPAQAQQVFNKDVGDSPALIAAFAAADADPVNYYHLHLVWRKDANGNTVFWRPQSTVTLTKGHVIITGSTSNNYPERYTFDGEGKRRLFAVIGATGYKPSLQINGITIQNGYSTSGSGGGLYASRAGEVTLFYSRIKNNRSNQPGSGIYIYESSFYMYKCLVDGNSNDQIGNCGGGLTASGGGITISNSQTVTNGATIHSSTISNNKSCRGGGVEIWGTINFYMTNSTLSGNEAVRRGGGLFFHGGYGYSLLRFNTIANNKAGTTPSIIEQEKHYGGGLAMWGYNGKIDMQGNVLAKNKVTYNQKDKLFYTTDDCYWDGGQFTSSANSNDNVIGQIANCSQFGSSFWWGIGWDNAPFDPKFGNLALSTTNEGFALPVQKPRVDSPLRGNYFPVVNGGCEGKDERGFNRVNFATRCDIGSVELGADGGQ